MSYSAEAEAEAIAEMIEAGATVAEAEAAIVHTIHGVQVAQPKQQNALPELVWTVGTEFGEETRVWGGSRWVTTDEWQNAQVALAEAMGE